MGINHRFLHSWQNTELVPCTKMKSLDTTCFKTACNEIISWFLFAHQWYFSAFIRSKVHSLTRCQHCFLKNMLLSRSHPDNLVYRWNPLDPPKSDLSDPDCPGHPTHFQPWLMSSSLTHTCRLQWLPSWQDYVSVKGNEIKGRGL